MDLRTQVNLLRIYTFRGLCHVFLLEDWLSGCEGVTDYIFGQLKAHLLVQF